jgi:HD-like signal output (HDOD) protein
VALSTIETTPAPDGAADQHPLAGLERLLARSIAAEALAGLEGLVRVGCAAPDMERADWEALVDRHHLAVGALTARRWQLPRLVREVMTLHHGAPGECADVRLLEVVRAADQVVVLVMARPRSARRSWPA